MSLIAGGHALLVGVPGLAKTLMVRSLAEAVQLDFRRIQFTPDLVPSDITGTEILEEDSATGARSFRFVRGPIFANIVLADEINRAPPRTQAALLEAMQEHQRDRGRRDDAAARAVLRARHAEPDRAGRHVSAARSAARPLPVRHPRRLSEGRRGDRDTPHHHGRATQGLEPMLGADEADRAAAC